MVDILRLPDTVRLFTDEDPTGTAGGEDAALRFDRHDRQLDVYLKADTAAPALSVCGGISRPPPRYGCWVTAGSAPTGTWSGALSTSTSIIPGISLPPTGRKRWAAV